jgi:nicotinamide riboside kinase
MNRSLIGRFNPPRFLEELAARKLNFVVVGGNSWTERTSNAEAVVAKFIAEKLNYQLPGK